MIGRRPTARAVKWAAAAADVLRRPAGGLVILGYHRVGGRSAVSVDLPRALFAEQMAYLAQRGRVVTLDAGLDRLARGEDESDGLAVAISFDDGTADFVEEALPVLVAQRIPAILYVATDHVERGLPFPHGGVAASWAGLADALSTGVVTVGSHTHSHLLLHHVDGATAADELTRSVDLIGERLGVGCSHFAYPKALRGSPAAEAEVRRRFRSAALGGGRVNPWVGTDVHRLARTPVQRADGMNWFARKAAGGMRLEGDLRGLLDTRRYRRSTV